MSSFSDFVDSPPHSCDHCKHLVVYRRDEEWWKKALGNDPDVEQHIDGLLSTRARKWILSIPVQPFTERFWRYIAKCAILDLTFGEVQQADCRFCNRINTQREWISKNGFGRANDHVIVRYDLHEVDDVTCRLHVEYLLYFWRDHYRVSPPSLVDYEVLTLSGIVQHLDDSISNELHRRPVNVSPSSQSSLCQLRHWRQECLTTHKSCHDMISAFMPTHVLEIEDHASDCEDYTVRLKETSKMKLEPYAALSYCWGGDQISATKKASYNRYLLGIHKQAIPRTIQDAILVARNLGISYLWVDSFCICQDNSSDMAREIAQMPQIYSQAAVTLIASNAKSSVDGFLPDRQQVLNRATEETCQLIFRNSRNQEGAIMLYDEGDDNEDIDEPLQLRGWALQEKLLSPRRIEFCQRQTRWKCRQMSKYDGWNPPHMWDVNPDRPLDHSSFDLSGSVPASSNIGAVQRREYQLEMWSSLLSDYTARSLTYGIDRLPAISGIAARMAVLLGDEYMAGLWKSDIASQLLWHVSDYPGRQARPQKYQGPSWSWAAVNGQVSHLEILARHSDFELLSFDIKHPGNSNLDPNEQQLSFGAVESGILRLRGRLQPVEYISHLDETCYLPSHLAICKTDVDPRLILDCNFIYADAIEETSSLEAEVYIPVFLLVVQQSHNRQLACLILQHLGGHTYSRFGVCRILSNRMWPEPEPESTLVRGWNDVFLRRKTDTLGPPPEWNWLETAPIEEISII